MLMNLLWIYTASVIISFVGLLIFRDGDHELDCIDIIVAFSISLVPGINIASLIGEILY